MDGKARGIGPFRPGYGHLPPYLAGREREQALFRRLVGALEEGVAPPAGVVLYGPRGNGKTALLVWLQRHIATVPGVEVSDLTPSQIGTPAQLAEQLLSEKWWEGLTTKESSLTGLTWRPGADRPPPPPRKVLAVRASNHPFALLLDEAHTLDPEVGNALLNASQQVASDLPFLLVLAGTPDIEDRLSTMEASFWHRADLISVNRLDDTAAAAAIERPLVNEGMAITEDALDRIVQQGDGYPFFLQWWGRLLWERAAAGGIASVTEEDVAAVAPEFERRRGTYYRHRYWELAKRRLLRVARAVADAFQDCAVLTPAALDEVVRGQTGEGRGGALADARRSLRHLGFIWRSGPTPDWEPGIPSLMDYIREHVPAS